MPRNAAPDLRAAVVGLVLIAASLLAACVPAPPPDRRIAPHPLDDRIWAVAEGRFVSPEALLAAMTGARYVLLGELHDNPRHHELQAWAVRGLVERNRRLALVAEMIAADQTNALRIFYGEPRANVKPLRVFLDWDNSGWPAFEMYAPIFDAALLGNYPIRAGNLDRTLLPAMHKTGWAALSDGLRATLAIPAQLPAGVGPALKAAIADSHCGVLPERVLEPFAEIQFARDAHLARALMTGAGADGAILIGGVGHARRDYGVPYQLRRLAARGPVVSLAFVETEAGKTAPQAYALPYDYVWFTPAPHREPPCLAQKP